MPYYYKDKSTNKIWSNANIEGAKPIKEAYRYYSMLDTTGTPGQSFPIDSFYIKDGSVPWFDAGYDTTAEINVKYGYMPVIKLCNSSISGKYYINNGSYVIPYGMTPMLYKTEIAKGVDSGFSMEHTIVDYSKGGKVSWRMSEENLRYFQPIDRGPTTEKLNSANSAHNLKNEFTNNDLNESVFRNVAFCSTWKDSPAFISPFYGYFINSKPFYNDNAFDFSAKGPIIGSAEYTPANFTLTVSSIKNAGYNKLNIKMDALYLYLNDSTLSPSPSYNKEYVNNVNSFSADSLNSGTTPYCQALFYATNNSTEWVVNSGIYPDTVYVGNGEIYSNLSKPITNTAALNAGKLVVSNTAEYIVTPIPYNDCTVKEIQELSNINVWNHMFLQQVVETTGMTSNFYRFKFYNKRKGETFDGFIPKKVIDDGYFAVNSFRDVGYEWKTWDDTNWNESLPSTTSINGCYSYTSSESSDFPNYRQLFFNDSAESGKLLCETNFTDTASTAYDKLTSLSSNWLLYSCQSNRNENYYYGHPNGAWTIVSPYGVVAGGGITFDLIYKNSTLDKYNNVMPDLSTEQQYKTTGYSPSAGICYSYTNVKLEHTIDLSSMSGDYLHIAYPFSTVFYNPNGILEQMIMTYEAEK